MKWMLLAAFLLGLAAGPADARPKSDLGQYQWKKRLLLVFAPSDHDAAYQKLNEQLQTSAKELAERDLMVFHLLAAEKGWVDETPISKDSVRSLYQEYGVRDETLTLVLIGKDGGEKMRQTPPFDLQAIFERIDAMPMRQREMQQRQGDGT
jgi:hypothetical protein